MRIPVVYRVALAIFAPFLVMSVFPGDEVNSVVSGLTLILVVSMVGAGIAVIRKDGYRPREQKVTLAVLALGVAGLLGGLYVIFSDIDPANPVLDDYVLEDRTLELPNPGLTGDYDVVTLTYGSGEDRRRAEFGADVDVVARKVDGTKLIDNWDGLSGWLRSSYWGFDVTELPLQARVWMPAGDGPFPLSAGRTRQSRNGRFLRSGIRLLGELLASRGIILASVDENFINSSISSLVEIWEDRPGLKEENDARGWLLLEHLAQWRDWNNEPGHRFSNQDRYGPRCTDRSFTWWRGGRSRSGFQRARPLPGRRHGRLSISALICAELSRSLLYMASISLGKGQRRFAMSTISRFTVTWTATCSRSRAWPSIRAVTFSGEDYRFRSGLYVVGANHGQFNTSWGNKDTGLFRAWALDLGRIMDGEAQRDVARVYFSAFLEIVLNDRFEYLPIFKDARYAANWLPETFFINQFSDSGESVIASFEEDIDPGTMPGGRIRCRKRKQVV